MGSEVSPSLDHWLRLLHHLSPVAAGVIYTGHPWGREGKEGERKERKGCGAGSHCGKFFKRLRILEGVLDHLTCLLGNLYAAQEATVGMGHGKTDWFKIGLHMSTCLFNLHAEYIMLNAGLQESQAGIKIARRNINNLRYAHDTYYSDGRKWRGTKSLLVRVKEESEKTGLKLNIQKTKIMASGPITSWQIDGKTMEKVTDFNFLGLQNHYRWCLRPWN